MKEKKYLISVDTNSPEEGKHTVTYSDGSWEIFRHNDFKKASFNLLKDTKSKFKRRVRYLDEEN